MAMAMPPLKVMATAMDWESAMALGSGWLLPSRGSTPQAFVSWPGKCSRSQLQPRGEQPPPQPSSLAEYYGCLHRREGDMGELPGLAPAGRPTTARALD